MSRHGKIAEGKTYLNINIEVDLKRDLYKLAKEQNRSLSNLAATILKEAAKRDIEENLKKASANAARVL